MTSTTTGNVVRVGGYTSVGAAAITLLQQYAHMDAAGADALIVIVSAVAAFVWNLMKDQGWIKDNR